MKTTQHLTVITEFKLKDKVVIHPNDGFDLDLMSTIYKLKVSSVLASQNDNFEGELFLSNDCKYGTIQLSPSYWQKIGKPNKVKLSITDDKGILYVGK
ncbi:MAG: hypothetical protein A2086_11170 [Spirochaetes bacterium GWD1_27_9]|nr:MAG: hypothetical protein A2Y34_00885 [Spirochaetes bacterium GWC1_27_15]OHD41513.1 MAG: hypothetical protein A2086_11170 [Spirochaetes bacterium GWD1_27_9]